MDLHCLREDPEDARESPLSFLPDLLARVNPSLSTQRSRGSIFSRWLVPLLVLGDWLAVGVFYFGSVWVRFPDSFALHRYPQVPITIALVGSFFLLLGGGYDRRGDFVSLRYVAEHVIAFAFVGLVAPLAIYTYSVYWEMMKPGRLNVAFTIASFLLVSLLLRRLLGIWRLRGGETGSLWILGDGVPAQMLDRWLRRHRWPLSWRFFALDPKRVGTLLRTDGGEGPILAGDLESALTAAQRVEAVVIAEDLGRIDSRLRDRLLEFHLRQQKVQSLSAFCASALRLVPLSTVTHDWLFEADLRLREQGFFDRTKRLFDAVAAALGLILAAPFLAVIALLVRADSSGPAFFRQQRMGQNGRPFTMLKFRTMTADGANGSRYTRPDDPRVTRVGAFLRRHRIDELPQLWNVLRGEMSFIGPRAEAVELVAEYEAAIPHYGVRHAVRPGITGWAQVNYPYGLSVEDTREKLCYDLYYVRYYSLLLDLSIVLKTVYTILRPFAPVAAETGKVVTAPPTGVEEITRRG